MRQVLTALLEHNLEPMLEDILAEFRQRLKKNRHNLDVEIINIRRFAKPPIKLILQALRGRQLNEKELDQALTDLGEQGARQGYPLSEVIGIFQLAREVIYRYIRKAYQKHPGIPPQQLLELDTQMCRLFNRIELGVVNPYLQFKDNIILAQQSFLKHKFSSLFKLVEAISSNLSIREFCKILLDYLCRFYNVKISGIFLLDEREKELYPQHITGLSYRFKNETRWSMLHGSIQRCLNEGRGLAIVDTPFRRKDIKIPMPEDNSKERKANRCPDSPECYSLYAPLIGRQGTYGVVSLHDLKMRRFSQTELQQIETLARITALALENAKFYENLIQEKGKLDAIINSMSDGLILFDFHEEIIFINEQAARYLQAPVHVLTGSSASLVPERLLANAKDSHVLQDSYLQALTNISDHPILEFTLYRTEVKDIRLTMFPVKDRENHFIGRGLIIEDISHAKAVNRMKSEFVAVASHSMRSPMTSILGFSSLLVERELTESTQRKYLNNIYRESLRLTNILNDMLELTNLEAGKMSLKLIAVEPGELAHSVVKEAGIQYRREIKLTSGGKLPRLIADRQKLHQVLHKLISNAVKYTTGKITLSVKRVTRPYFRKKWNHSNVNLNIPGMYPAIAFCLEDEGKGVPADKLEEIFEPFFRLEPEYTKVQDGSGLGLAIIRYLIHAHGGKLWVESKPGQGSAFTFILPLELTRPAGKTGTMVM
ncbi:GAF domain-containing sensor histidine kinase [bacterium]|nr:GAF domain-containing sensor histidine kinase [bacterium]